MEAVWISTAIVAIAEIGDKTQLLAIVLAAKFRKPVPIILGILVATLLNHGVAAGLGVLLADLLEGFWFRLLIAISFIAMAGWALIPDEEEELKTHGGGSVFLATTIAFFLVEIGDKTQIATTLLGAEFENILLVTIGTTAGMMLANVPAVYLGNAALKVFPLKYVRWSAAGLFFLIGIWILFDAVSKSGFFSS